jgi:hypothetical protein
MSTATLNEYCPQAGGNRQAGAATAAVSLGRPSQIGHLAIVVAAFAAFVTSSLYYSHLLLGNVWRLVDPVAAAMTFSPWKLLVEIPRTLGVTLVMARFLTMLGGNDPKSAAKLALWL